MNQYYQDILNEIGQAIQDKKYDYAQGLIQQELAMPYIPDAVQIQLEHYVVELKAACCQPMMATMEQILHWMSLGKEFVAYALESVALLNLSLYPDEIQLLLDAAPTVLEQGALLLEYRKQKLEIPVIVANQTIIPATLTMPYETEWYQQVYLKLMDLFESDPFMKEICIQLWVSECLAILPGEYELSQVPALVDAIVKNGYVLSNNANKWYDYTVKYHKQPETMSLRIEQLALFV